MKILVVGGTGTIGSAVIELLKNENEVISVGRNRGDYQVDIEDKSSIEKMFEEVGEVDGIISTAGNARLGTLQDETDEGISIAVNNKLMGQVNLVRIGEKYLRPNGFFVLTSGTAAHNPFPGAVFISMTCGALESFTQAAAIELSGNKRINIVSPAFVKETLEMMGRDSSIGVSALNTAKYYIEAIESGETGKTYIVK